MATKTGKCAFCEAQGYQFYKFFLCPECAKVADIWHDGEQWGSVYVRKGGNRVRIGDFGRQDESEVVREKEAMVFWIANQPSLA